jgi:probable F420-dependent oxidoreductase
MGWGLTVPQLGMSLTDHQELLQQLPAWGYTDAWSAEVSGADAFVPLALASAWQPTLRLGTAIVPAFTRGPALIAMSAATMAAAAPGRFVLGIGASSPVIVGSWNGIEFDEPYRKTRDVLRIVKQALAGERVDGTFDTVTITRFKLDQPPSQPPPVMLAALRPQMLRLAGREADGAILNWLAEYDVARCLDAIGVATETVARIFVCPTEDVDYARTLSRRLLSTYLTVPAYAAFHDWLGRGDVLRPMHEAWAAGDRAAAAAAIPDDVADDLMLHGSPESVRDRVHAYADAGITTPLILLLPPPDGDLVDVIRRLGPAS